MPVNNSTDSSPTFSIGKVPVCGDAILAPMDGYSDWPYRSICRGLGSAMSYTEFVRAEYIVKAFKHMRPRLKFEETERPVALQIYGDDPDELLEAALRLQELSPDIVDINMGCPARTVASSGAGVGLMRTPLKVARIFRKISAALPIPVTGKIRIGWDNFRSYKLIARIVEENGGAAIAVHGRTKEQMYGGEADWDVIAEVKAAVKIPVIGNGDVRVAADIDRLKAHTGCEAVMIGRAAVGNPWIFARMDRSEVPLETVRQMVHLHLARTLEFYGPDKGLYIFRKHAMQYMKLQNIPRLRRVEIIEQKSPERFVELLEKAWADFGGTPAK